MDKSILRAMFDEMWDRFQNSGETGLEDIHADIMKHWRDFLSAGFDANKVAAMMPPEEIFTHYDVLTSHGAEIDATELSFKLEDADFVKEHLADFAKRGADINRIAKERFTVGNDGMIETLLRGGVDVNIVFELAEETLSGAAEYIEGHEGLVNTLLLFSKYGLPTEEIKEWVMGKLSQSDLAYSIVWDEYGYGWGLLGITATDEIIETFLMPFGSGDPILCNDVVAILDNNMKLPKTISHEKFVRSIPMRGLVDYYSSYGFNYFLEEYSGDINVLVDKFINEIGYDTTDEACIIAMYDIIAYGGAGLIDLEKFVECFKKCDKLTGEDRRDYYEYLSDIEGIDKKIIAKLL